MDTNTSKTTIFIKTVIVMNTQIRTLGERIRKQTHMSWAKWMIFVEKQNCGVRKQGDHLLITREMGYEIRLSFEKDTPRQVLN